MNGPALRQERVLDHCDWSRGKLPRGHRLLSRGVRTLFRGGFR
jgi:hypothetical protein